jgi:hypothetical protein
VFRHSESSPSVYEDKDFSFSKGGCKLSAIKTSKTDNKHLVMCYSMVLAGKAHSAEQCNENKKCRDTEHSKSLCSTQASTRKQKNASITETPVLDNAVKMTNFVKCLLLQYRLFKIFG